MADFNGYIVDSPQVGYVDPVVSEQNASGYLVVLPHGGYGYAVEPTQNASGYLAQAGGGYIWIQRVWDSGGGGRWCYYSKNFQDNSPLSGDTTPNWTGSISKHEVIAAVEA